MIRVVELDEDHLLGLHVREVPPAVPGRIVEDGRGEHVLLARDRGVERIPRGDLSHIDLGVVRTLVITHRAALAQRERHVLRRRRQGAPQTEADEAPVTRAFRLKLAVERGGAALRATLSEVHVRLGGGRLHRRTRSRGVAHHATERYHDIRAGQALRDLGNLGGIG